MKKSELKQLIKEVLTEDLNDEIKKGTKVYWNIRVGMYPRRISGIVLSVDENEIALIKQTTQNTYGKIIKKSINKLNKNKDQTHYGENMKKSELKKLIKEVIKKPKMNINHRILAKLLSINSIKFQNGIPIQKN